MEVKDDSKTNHKQNYVVCSDDNVGNLEGCVEFEFPRDGFVQILNIVGCVNGVVCLKGTWVNSKSGSVDPTEVVMLWNPLIRRFLHLPNSDKESRFWKCLYTFGFVFDCVRNDYKVLRVYSIKGLCDHPTMIEIFRSSTGLWEDIADNPPFVRISRRSVQADLDGISHWIGEDSNGKVKIISFDTYEEVFGIIDLPVKAGNFDEIFHNNWGTYLFVFDKSLFFIELVAATRVDDGFLFPPFKKTKFCIWRMKKYGVVESWTQVHHCVFDMSVDPLGFMINGEILWAGWNGELVSTNLEDGTQKYIRTYEKGTYFSSYSYYVESLELLDKTSSTVFEESSGKRIAS